MDAGLASSPARFQNLTIADGFSENEKAGGILNDGTLTVSNSTFSDNVASSTFVHLSRGEAAAFINKRDPDRQQQHLLPATTASWTKAAPFLTTEP